MRGSRAEPRTGAIDAGLIGHLANLAIIVGLIANPYTAGGATLFYGATMLIAAWRGQRGCESTVVSNLVLRRDDQIGCPLFGPFDELEDHLRRPKDVVMSRSGPPSVHLLPPKAGKSRVRPPEHGRRDPASSRDFRP